MSDRIQLPSSAGDEVDRVTKVLVAQVFALDEMFYRAAKEAFSTEDISYYQARKALKAQARCRATLKVLLALRKRGIAEKFPNLSERTIQNNKTPDLPKPYPVGGAPVRGLLRRKSGRGRKGWTPERRARQALGDPHVGAVAEIDRPADGSRKSPLSGERAQARLEKQGPSSVPPRRPAPP